MKKIGFLISAMIFCQVVLGQIKVLPSGCVGIGTNNPQHKLHLDGMLYLTYGNYSGKLKMAAGNQGPIIGSNSGKINFWYSDNGFNQICAKELKTISDSTVKEQIVFFDNGLDIITQLNTYSYFFKNDSMPDRKRKFGLLAQEVETILPELVDTSMECKLLDYNQFIPFLINAIKEQQVQIQSLYDQINSHEIRINEQQVQINILQQIVTFQEVDLAGLRNEVNILRDEMMVLRTDLDYCCEGKILYRNDTLINYNDTTVGGKPALNESILYQNKPNPFNTNTQISYYLPATVQTAYLYIYNLNGTQLKSYTLTLRGVQAVTVYASELPAGMYLYTLVVDNVIIDSKRMILTK